MSLKSAAIGILISAASLALPAMAKPKDLRPDYVLPDDRLRVAEEAAFIKQQFENHLGIDVRVTPTLVEVDNENDPIGDYSFHNIEFGRLTKESYTRVMNYYQFPIAGGKLPQIQFDPNRIYTLKDFLVPKIQPLLGKVFFGAYKLAKLDPSAKPESMFVFNVNCWTTVHGVLTSDRQPFEFFGYIYDFEDEGRSIYKEVLANSATSAQLNPNSTQLRAYDYFVNSVPGSDGSKAIMHTALIVGPGIVFEKSGVGRDRFRVSAHTIESRFEYRRLTSRLPLPKDFTLNQASVEDDIYWRYPATMIRDGATGNYILDPNNPISLGVKNPLIRICTKKDAEKNLCSNNPFEQGKPDAID